MLNFNRYQIILLVGLVGLALVMAAKKQELEDELEELVQEYKQTRVQCQKLCLDLGLAKKNGTEPCPNVVKKHDLCKDYLKTLKQHMKGVVAELDKEDDADDHSDDDD